MTAKTTYRTAVRSFDHQALATIAAYPALRQALSDFGNEAGHVSLADFLDAVRDMALTAPYGDSCQHCKDPSADDGTYMQMAWPHAVDRKGDWLRCTYLCPRCSATWTCGYSVRSPEYF
jgi:hypothetical protein